MAAAEVKVIDKEGKWFVNTAMFRFVHGLRENVHFDPGVPVRIVHDAWIKGQELLKEIEDPFGDMPPSVTAETPIDGGKNLKDPTTLGADKSGETKTDDKAGSGDAAAGGDAKGAAKK